MSVEQQLRDTFERYADRTSTPVDAHAEVLRRHRLLQRRRLAGGTFAVGLVLAVAIPITVEVLEQPAAGFDVSVDGGDYVPGTPRGSLANDEAFLAEVVTVPWVITPDGSQPPIADRKVIFAGDVPGGRWARVVAEVDGQWQGVWLTGPVGAAGESLSPAGDADLDVTEIQVRGDFDSPEGPVVVLAAPGDQIAISAKTLVTAEGTTSRVYGPVPTEDGVAVVGMPDGRAGAVSIRVLRDGRLTFWTAGIQGDLDEDDWSTEEIAAALEGARGTPDDQLAHPIVTWVSVPTGFRPGALSPKVLWGGAVQLDGEQRAQALLATTEFPSGARALVGGWGITAGGLGSSGVSLLELYPAGATLPNLVAMRCDIQISPQAPDLESHLVIIAPSAGVWARVMDGDRVLREVALAEGIATTVFPDGADRVVALDADGEVIGDEAIGGLADLQLRDDISVD